MKKFYRNSKLLIRLMMFMMLYILIINPLLVLVTVIFFRKDLILRMYLNSTISFASSILIALKNPQLKMQ